MYWAVGTARPALALAPDAPASRASRCCCLAPGFALVKVALFRDAMRFLVLSPPASTVFNCRQPSRPLRNPLQPFPTSSRAPHSSGPNFGFLLGIWGASAQGKEVGVWQGLYNFFQPTLRTVRRFQRRGNNVASLNPPPLCQCSFHTLVCFAHRFASSLLPSLF